MEQLKEKAGFTKTGFSKSRGFGMCARFSYCDNGKGRCHYEAIDPEVKSYCHLYQRGHSNDLTIREKPVPVVQLPVEEPAIESDFEQMSLF